MMLAVGGYASDSLLIDGCGNFTSYDDQEGSNWASVFGTTTAGALLQVVITSLQMKMMTKMVHLMFTQVLKNS